MDPKVRDEFTRKWKKYFNKAELPIAFYYTDTADKTAMLQPTTAHRCVIANVVGVRKGKTVAFDNDTIGCFGGRRYLGYSQTIRPEFEYFLSCGIPGKLEGERYKKSPELVKKLMESAPPFTAPKKYVVFKPWDKLDRADEPEVVVFFAPPDVLSGLFTLAGFDESDVNGVTCPSARGAHPSYSTHAGS